MARMQWFDGNYGFYGYDLFQNYVESSRSATGMVLELGPNAGPFDPEKSAVRIELTYANFTSAVITSGPNTGADMVTGGKLTAITYFNGNGDVLLQVDQINVLLPVFLATIAHGDGFAAWQMVTVHDNTVKGSNDASGPGHLGTGDVLDSGMGRDLVNALGGDDYIQDRGGVDTYNGGNGFDTLAYDTWFFRPWAVVRGVTADLVLGTATGPDGASDTLSAIEGLTGSYLADKFYGNAVGNKFTGFCGADRFDGRGGLDLASYTRDASQGGLDGIRVNLAAGTVRDGFGTIDHLISVEGVEGTAQRDTFQDNRDDNYFNGGAGNDLFTFSSGNDTAFGGPGADSFVFAATAFGSDTIQDFDSGSGDTITCLGATVYGQIHFASVTIDGQMSTFVQTIGGSLTLLGIDYHNLTAADFGF